MEYDYEALEFWFTAAAVTVSAAAGIVGRMIRRNARRIDDLEGAQAEHLEALRSGARAEVRAIELQLEAKFETHDRDIAALRAGQITHDDLGRVYRRLDGVIDSVAQVGKDLGAQVSELRGEMTATRSQASLVYEHLLKRDGRA